VSRSDRALARSLAIELSSDDPDPTRVIQLRSALPKPTDEAPSKFNFDRLSDADMADLERIYAKATTPAEGEAEVLAAFQTDRRERERAMADASALPLN